MKATEKEQKEKDANDKKEAKERGKWIMIKKIMTYWINIESRARQALLPG